ncbi:hypothetical protein V1T75_09195 [Tenacibaculum sp. FZY0031]|uniref:hypothetical protein n=1 Tax=Tenacibaculum sp. FZY0031 TaxID=3116648 RepID=UPI002E982407|nr:hypothetical protein [Tenacibaculum sp. FZY0031]
MTNNVRLSLSVSNFEPISENTENKLIGGFSQSISSSIRRENPSANNCEGQNCASGCTGGDPQNTKCNTVTNCGGSFSGSW